MKAQQGGSTLYAALRAGLSLLGGVLGYLAALWLERDGVLTGVINLVYLTILGVLIAFLISDPIAKRLERGYRRLGKLIASVPPQAVLAAIVGTVVALIITVLLNSLFSFAWYWSLILTVVLVTASSWFFVVNRTAFAMFSGKATPSLQTHHPESLVKLVDTSAIIDGRIADVIEANFLEGELLIPKFILAELQNIADSSDPLRRTRGRRGLEILDKLVNQTRLKVEVISDNPADIKAVDEKLIRLCQLRHAALITTDYNLNRVATLQNVRVLNVHQLANVMRAMFLPGERLALHIVKEGREAGQGLAYLDDGTMVVVDDAQAFVGKTIDVIVTSNLQTNMGRMIFARTHQGESQS